MRIKINVNFQRSPIWLPYTSSKISSLFWPLPNRKKSRGPQKKRIFNRWFDRWSQISFRRYTLYRVQPNKLSWWLSWLIDTPRPSSAPNCPDKPIVSTASWSPVSCVNSCFVNDYETANNFAGLRLNNTKHSFEVSFVVNYDQTRHPTYG